MICRARKRLLDQIKLFHNNNKDNMKRNLIPLAILLLTGFCVQAQTTSTIIGIVVELETQEPMQYVNVALLNESDSTLVAGTVTDDEGEFEFLDVESKQYRIKISFIGFESVEISYLAPPGEHELGLIPIKRSAILKLKKNI